MPLESRQSKNRHPRLGDDQLVTPDAVPMRSQWSPPDDRLEGMSADRSANRKLRLRRPSPGRELGNVSPHAASWRWSFRIFLAASNFRSRSSWIFSRRPASMSFGVMYPVALFSRTLL